MLAPGGRRIGARLRGAGPEIRNPPGGLRAAKAMLGRLIAGRGAIGGTPSGYTGRM